MSRRSRRLLGLFLFTTTVGLALLALSSLWPLPATPAPTPSAVRISVSTATAPDMPGPTIAPAATVAPTPVPTPTLVPAPTPTRTLISSPLVSSNGRLAYVEDGELMVVGVDGSRVRVANERVEHDAQAATWSPDGRWLLHVAEAGESTYQVWDSETGATVDLIGAASGFPTGTGRLQGIDWSPQGRRLLFYGHPDEAPGVWVLDLENASVWQVTDRAVVVAYWVDEQTILFDTSGGDASEHGPAPSMALGTADIGPPPQELTQTLSLSGGIVDVPHAFSPDRRYLARLDVSHPQGPRLEVAPLPGHPSLTPLAVPLGEALPGTTVGSMLLWSPDSRWIAYSAAVSAAPEEQGAYTILIDTKVLGRISGGDLQSERLPVITGFRPSAWSPDGRLLTGLTCSEPMCRLSVIDVDLDQVTTLASGETLQLWDLAWSPGGTYLAYSLSGLDAESTGLMLWDRGTGEQLRLMPTSEMRPLTDLQWTPDGCRLYVAEREDRDQLGLSVAAIWGVGPAWEDVWRIAPGAAATTGASIESAEAIDDEGPKPCPASPLADRRLVAYYGTPLGPGLGVLGRNGIIATLNLLSEQAQVYRELDPDTETIPAFHMVTTIADSYPGDDGDYNHRVGHELIRQWIEGVKAAGGWSILDVQPGRADLDTEWDVVEPLLLDPTVHLAVDPEFIVSGEEIPGTDLGRITGPQVNRLQARLDRIGRAIGHRKMLIIHQFNDRMIQQKGMILNYPFVELVWDADGFGSPKAKVEDYNQYRREAGFEHGGFKLFYDEDAPLMTPEQVLAL
ncbi:MAG: hypothetical protein PVF04_03020, partial [Anaerolineae bacterium]